VKLVKHFRQVLLWPLQLMPLDERHQIHKHWELLEKSAADNPWRELRDEFGADASRFEERHYSEFVTFLPHVQRFLYGEGRSRATGAARGESPIRAFGRTDVAKVRLSYANEADAAEFAVANVALYFFFDIDAIILVVEIFANDLPLARAQDTLYRFGRAYPPAWEADGSASHCLKRVEWLSTSGAVLAVSDYERREKYLASVREYRAPCIASHWEFLLRPLVLHHSGDRGAIRYRQVEYYRMPLMAYLAMEDPRELTRLDFVRLGLVTAPAGDDAPPYSERHIEDFEARCCYDRYWSATGSRLQTRFLCSGQALVIVAASQDRFCVDPERGLLSQFRHQYFLLFLIAHLHRAALLMLSDRLVAALNRLDIQQPESVKQFKRTIRQVFEIFLRFTHRYWFHDLSDQAQIKALFRLACQHLESERLYAEVWEEIQAMSHYLDSDALRRQANTVVRLTVVTTFGLIGTVATGFLGMNLIAAADSSLWVKTLYFALVLIPTFGVAFYTIFKSKRLSDFLEALSDERLPAGAKLQALLDVWRTKPRSVPGVEVTRL
jgi:hypothetical protein